MSSHPYIMGWRPSNGISRLHMAVWLQVKVRERGLRSQHIYRLYACSVCDTKAPLQLQHASCGAI